MSRFSVPIRSLRLCVGLALLVVSTARADIYTYSIGNSLTVDSNVLGMAEMAASRGTTVHADRHVHGGVRLDYIWLNPNTTTETPYFAGTFQNAYTNYTWDAITLQPFYQSLYGEYGDADIIVRHMNLARLSNPANIDTQFYIFARWPEISTFSPDYTGIWTSPYLGDNGATTATVDFNQEIIAEVRKRQPKNMKPVQLIPTGHVLAEIHRQIQTGDLTGLSSITELYRDNTHMSSLGSFVASMTFYATIFHDDPMGLATPSGYPAFDPDLVQDLQTIIWNVVNRRPWDMRDPEVPSAFPTSVVVPEPAVAGMLFMVIALARFRRRHAEE